MHRKYCYFKNTCLDHFNAIFLEPVFPSGSNRQVFKDVYVNMDHEAFSLIFASGAQRKKKNERQNPSNSVHPRQWPSRK